MTTAVDRGGPFARKGEPSRNWMRATAPGIGFRFAADESSPIGGGFRRVSPRQHATRWRRLLLALAIALLAAAGTMSVGHGAYMYAKAQLAQVLLQSAWDQTRAGGVPVRPWPWADTHPVARIIVPGKHRLGCLTTLAVGVVGAFIGGLIGNVILGHAVRFRFDLVPFLLAVVGSVVLLLILQALGGRRRRPF